jgi:hypothetical protein
VVDEPHHIITCPRAFEYCFMHCARNSACPPKNIWDVGIILKGVLTSAERMGYGEAGPACDLKLVLRRWIMGWSLLAALGGQLEVLRVDCMHVLMFLLSFCEDHAGLLLEQPACFALVHSAKTAGKGPRGGNRLGAGRPVASKELQRRAQLEALRELANSMPDGPPLRGVPSEGPFVGIDCTPCFPEFPEDGT